MKIMIIDPEINGELEIYNNLDESCGVINFGINIEHCGINSLPIINLQFQSYLNILGKDIRGIYEHK